jgi:hypothetical protein
MSGVFLARKATGMNAADDYRKATFVIQWIFSLSKSDLRHELVVQQGF